VRTNDKSEGLEVSVRAKKSYPLQFYLLIAFIFFISPLSISFGDTEARVTVVNKTDKYLHVFIDGAPHLYVAPGRSASKEAAKTDFSVSAFYAPGQGITASVDTTITITDYTPSSTTTGCDDNDNDNSGCDCNQTTTPADYGSETYEITTDLMTVQSN